MAKAKKPESTVPTSETSTGTTSYSASTSFCQCGAELPPSCGCCGQKLSVSKAQEIHNTITHS